MICDVITVTPQLKPFRPLQDSSKAITAEDVRRIWSDHVRFALPECPWTAFWSVSNYGTTELNFSGPRKKNNFMIILLAIAIYKT